MKIWKKILGIVYFVPTASIFFWMVYTQTENIKGSLIICFAPGAAIFLLLGMAWLCMKGKKLLTGE